MPIAFFVGKHDLAVSREITLKAKEILGDSVVSYHETNGGHNIFSIGKDQKIFKTEGLKIIRKYNS